VDFLLIPLEPLRCSDSKRQTFQNETLSRHESPYLRIFALKNAQNPAWHDYCNVNAVELSADGPSVKNIVETERPSSGINNQQYKA